jgi:hypothetical protein
LHRPITPLPGADPGSTDLAAAIDRWFIASRGDAAVVVLADVRRDDGLRGRALARARREEARVFRAFTQHAGGQSIVLRAGSGRIACLRDVTPGSGPAFAAEMSLGLPRVARWWAGGRGPRVTVGHAELDRNVVRPGALVAEILSTTLIWAGATDTSCVSVPVA